MKLLIPVFLVLLINFIFITDIFVINIANAQNSSRLTENKINNTNKSLTETPITISNSLNETTIKAISNSLNDKNSKLVIPLIQSINSSISKTIDQSGYTEMSANAATISAIFAAGSAIILLISFLSQNRLINKQIEQHNIFLRKERELHYQELKIILKKILSYNFDFFNQLISYDFITSLKLDYKIEDINNIVERNIAKIHLKHDYTKFDEDLQKIKRLINNLDSEIVNFESHINQIVKEKLSNFDLDEPSGKSKIINCLYDYWYEKFRLFEKNNNGAHQFNSNFRGIEKDYGARFDGEYYSIGGVGIFRKSNSKSNDEKGIFVHS